MGIDVIVPRIVPQTIALGAAAGAVNEPLLLANGSFEFWFTADFGLRRSHPGGQEFGWPGNRRPVRDLDRDGGKAFFALGDEQTIYAASSAAGSIVAGEPTHLVANFGGTACIYSSTALRLRATATPAVSWAISSSW